MPRSAFQHLAVCLPAFDEADSLRTLIPELDGALAGLGLKRVSVVIFDDASQDSTADVVMAAGMSNATLTLVQSRVRVGKAAGLHRCFTVALQAGADAIVMMDADGQDDPAYIFDLLVQLKSGLDVVNGRRTNRAHGPGKRLSSRAFNAAVRLLTRQKIWDVNSGLKGFSRRGAENLVPYLYGELHRVLVVVAIWLGLLVGETPVTNRARTAGRTKYGPARGWRGLFDLGTVQFIRRYHSRPGHFFSGVGVALILIGALFSGLGLASLAAGGSFAVLVLGGIVVAGFGFILAAFGFLSEWMLFLSKGAGATVVRLTQVGMDPSES